ncbi:hypothetical protein D3C72_1540550 [compost metagenome]
MRQHRDGGNDAQAHVSHEGGSDQDAVAKTVHAVTRQQRPAARRVVVVRMPMALRGRSMIVGMAVVRIIIAVTALLGRRVAVFVAMVPKLGLVQQKEEDQSQQQGHEQGLGIDLALERLGQQMHKGRGQQSARRQAEQVLRAEAAIFTANAAAHQGGRDPHAAQAGGQCGQHDCYQSHCKLSN